MKAIRASLIIQMFKPVNKSYERRMGLMDLCCSDVALNEYPCSMDKFAKIAPIFLWENRSKKTRTRPKDIQIIFRGFIAA